MLHEEVNFVDIEMDKLIENYNLRIPEVLKHQLDTLSTSEKKILNTQIIIVMARAIHNKNFNPEMYLNTKG